MLSGQIALTMLFRETVFHIRPAARRIDFTGWHSAPAPAFRGHPDAGAGASGQMVQHRGKNPPTGPGLTLLDEEANSATNKLWIDL